MNSVLKKIVKNSKVPLEFKGYASTLGSKELRPKKNGKILPFVARIREPNEALPPQVDIWRNGTYRTGDGEVLQSPRPGSLDFLKWPSRGDRT
jgi:hypothetical protein